MTTGVNLTIHERLPYCDCDLCKCNHGFSLDIGKKSEVVGKPAAVYMSLKKWDFLLLSKFVDPDKSSIWLDVVHVPLDSWVEMRRSSLPVFVNQSNCHGQRKRHLFFRFPQNRM